MRFDMKKIFSILIAFFFLLTVVGCTSKADSTAPNNKKFKIAYISDTYGEEDVKNKEIIDGVNESFKNYDFSFDIKVPTSSENYGTVANGLLSSTKYDLVLANSPAVCSSLLAVHSDYPTSNLGFIGYGDETNNSMSITFKNEEGAFLSGYLAAKSTKTNVLGYIGAYENKNQDYEYGFMSGVKAANANVKVEKAFTNSYIDAQAGSKIAEELVSKKADVFFTVCGAGAIGVDNVIREKGLKVIDSDLYNKSDNEIKLGEIYKNYKNAAMSICDSVIFVSFNKNVNNLGVGDSVVNLKLNPNFYKDGDSVTLELEECKKDIATGALKVPKDNKSFETFKYKTK